MPERKPKTPKRNIITAYISLNRNEGQTIVRTIKLPPEETELPPEKAEAVGRIYETEHKEIVLELSFYPVNPLKIPTWAKEPYFKDDTSIEDERTITELALDVFQGNAARLDIYLPPNKRNLITLLRLILDALNVSDIEDSDKELLERTLTDLANKIMGLSGIRMATETIT